MQFVVEQFRVVDAGEVKVLGKVEYIFDIVRIQDSKFMEGFSSTNPALSFRSAAEVCRRDYNQTA